jgi:hypothetical protein
VWIVTVTKRWMRGRKGTIHMVTIECPWCDDDLVVGEADAVRCDGCGVELGFAPDPGAAAVPLAA